MHFDWYLVAPSMLCTPVFRPILVTKAAWRVDRHMHAYTHINSQDVTQAVKGRGCVRERYRERETRFK